MAPEKFDAMVNGSQGETIFRGELPKNDLQVAIKHIGRSGFKVMVADLDPTNNEIQSGKLTVARPTGTASATIPTRDHNVRFSLENRDYPNPHTPQVDGKVPHQIL